MKLCLCIMAVSFFTVPWFFEHGDLADDALTAMILMMVMMMTVMMMLMLMLLSVRGDSSKQHETLRVVF